MRCLRRFSFIIFFLIFLSSAFAAGPSVQLKIDKTEGSFEDTFQVQVVVNGSQSVPTPEIKHPTELDLKSTGSSTQMQIINGDFKASKTFSYLLLPKEAGEFTLGPAEVQIDGTTYTSDVITLKIEKTSFGGSPGSNGAANIPKKHGSAFITAEVNHTDPYVNQPVIFTFRLFSQVDAENAQLEAPEFEGFLKESLGDTKTYQKTINGENWEVSEVKWLLFPLTAGEKTLRQMTLSADFATGNGVPGGSLFQDPFFNSLPRVFRQNERKVFRTDPITLNVQPLPEAGKPDFFQGLVGEFRLKAEINVTKAKVGDSLAMTLTLEGDGNLREFAGPTLSSNDDYKVYDEKPTFEINARDDGIWAKKVFKKDIVPLQGGKITIPEIKIATFNPKTKQYVTIKTEPLVIDVEGERTTPPKNDKPPAAMPVEAPQASSLMKKVWAFGGGFLAGLILLIIGVVLYQSRNKKPVSIVVPQVSAKDEMKELLKKLDNLSTTNDIEYVREALHLLRDYLSLRYGIEAHGMTVMDVNRLLLPLGWQKKDCEELKSILNLGDQIVFGGHIPTTEQKNSLKDKIKAILLG